MASSRIAVCLLAILATVSAFVVTGCGGRSSASGTAESVSSTSKTSDEVGSNGGEKTAEAKSSEGKKTSKSNQGSAEKAGKKHPPLSLPATKPEKGPTPEQSKSVPRADIEMKLAGSVVTGAIPPLPKESTCKGKDEIPSLEWTNPPEGTKELILFAMNLAPVSGKLYFDGAFAGLDPSLTELKNGKLPAGTIVGKNSAGQNKYSICPKGEETYVFALYAVPETLAPQQGFDPLALRTKATPISPSVGITTLAYVPE